MLLMEMTRSNELSGKGSASAVAAASVPFSSSFAFCRAYIDTSTPAIRSRGRSWRKSYSMNPLAQPTSSTLAPSSSW